MRFLAIDDDEFSIDLLKKNLSEHGYNDVTTFFSARAALEHLDAVHRPNEAICHYDCLLVDIQMPEMDGIELCKELRGRSYCLSVPILMITSLGAREYVTRAISAGATDYIVKPVSPVDLVARISAASAIVQEQRRVLDQYIRFVTEVKEHTKRGASYNLPFNATEAENFINYRTLESYLAALRDDDMRQVAALAFRIDRELLDSEAVSDDRFLRLNRRVARKFSKNLPGKQSLFTYIGRGTYVVLFDKASLSDILKAVSFVERRFQVENAYPSLKLEKGRVVELNALHDRAEDLLLHSLTSLDSSDLLQDADLDGVSQEASARKPHITASIWTRLFRRETLENEEPVASMEEIRLRFIERLSQDFDELSKAIELASRDQADKEALSLIGSHAHRTAGVAKTLGFELLGVAAGSLDTRLSSLISESGDSRIDDDTRAQLKNYLQLCGQAGNNSVTVEMARDRASGSF